MKPLSRQFLLSRNICCGSGCLNCPYIPVHCKGSKSINNGDLTMNYEKNYGADYYCVHCDSPIYFSIGTGCSDNCPSCGRNYMKTEDQENEENCDRIELDELYNTEGYWMDDIKNRLLVEIDYLDSMFGVGSPLIGDGIPLKVLRKMEFVKVELEKIVEKI